MRVVMRTEMSWQVNEEASRDMKGEADGLKWRSDGWWEWWWGQRWADKWMRRQVETWQARLTDWIWELIPHGVMHIWMSDLLFSMTRWLASEKGWQQIIIINNNAKTIYITLSTLHEDEETVLREGWTETNHAKNSHDKWCTTIYLHFTSFQHHSPHKMLSTLAKLTLLFIFRPLTWLSELLTGVLALSCPVQLTSRLCDMWCHWVWLIMWRRYTGAVWWSGSSDSITSISCNSVFGNGWW